MASALAFVEQLQSASFSNLVMQKLCKVYHAPDASLV